MILKKRSGNANLPHQNTDLASSGCSTGGEHEGAAEVSGAAGWSLPARLNKRTCNDLQTEEKLVLARDLLHKLPVLWRCCSLNGVMSRDSSHGRGRNVPVSEGDESRSSHLCGT